MGDFTNGMNPDESFYIETQEKGCNVFPGESDSEVEEVFVVFQFKVTTPGVTDKKLLSGVGCYQSWSHCHN